MKNAEEERQGVGDEITSCRSSGHAGEGGDKTKKRGGGEQ